MAKTRNPKNLTKQDQVKVSSNHPAPPPPHHQNHPVQKPASWAVVRSLFTCKHLQVQLQQQQQQQKTETVLQQNVQQKKQRVQPMKENNKKIKSKKVMCSGSLCNNTKVMHKPELPSPQDKKKKKKVNSMDSVMNSNQRSSRSISKYNDFNAPVVSPNYSNSSPFKGMPFMKLSGCYECRMVVDPVLGFSKDPSLRATICSCNICGEIFMKADYLELHQATRHAVSELGPEDTSKNIVEIIFQSSWLRKQFPVCKIERVLKVHNTPKTIAKFEEYRESIKTKATKLPRKHPRCIADGNELLRFHCTTFMCSLGLNGSSNLCNSIPNCGVCSLIKSGFRTAGETAGKGILTTATSGRAHDNAGVAPGNEKRAMLVCRVIAGRVKKSLEGSLEEYDSVAGAAGVYANLDELFVFNPRAILPCFVVIYEGF